MEHTVEIVTLVGSLVAIGVGGIWGLLGAVRHHKEWELRNRSGGRVTGGDAATLHERMSRLENAVESVAVEMERVGEGQRFITRVLGERSAVPDPQARPVTPVA